MQTAKVFTPLKSKYLVFTTQYIVPCIICLLIIFGFYLTFYSNLFVITDISCNLDFMPCDNPAILAELDKLKDQNIFTLKTTSVSSKFTSGDFTIRGSQITKELPGKLKVELESVYPVVALKIKDVSTWVALDDKYRVITQRDSDPNVPTVIVSGPLTLALGKPITSPDLLNALNLTRRLFEQLPSIKSITLVDENRLDVLLDNGKIAILTPKKDVPYQLRSLQAILQEVTISEGVRIIDVRFSQPVLR
ncbi:MAG: cell division protein FtsQ/DivIB [Microgenomates group bacterium]